MNQKTLSEALSAIVEESLKLMSMELPEEAAAKVDLIHSIARYQHDIRTSGEKAVKAKRKATK